MTRWQKWALAGFGGMVVSGALDGWTGWHWLWGTTALLSFAAFGYAAWLLKRAND